MIGGGRGCAWISMYLAYYTVGASLCWYGGGMGRYWETFSGVFGRLLIVEYELVDVGTGAILRLNR